MSNKIKYNDEVHEHIALSIRQYPTLYNCRTDVLEHMCCVLGNGYDWKDGRLVTDPYKKVYKSANQMIKEHRISFNEAMPASFKDIPKSPMSLAKDVLKETILRFKFDNAHILALVNWDTDDSIGTFFKNDMNYIYFKTGHRIYPMHKEYSTMLAIPDDARPEWVNACREMCIQIFKVDESAHYSNAYSDKDNNRNYKNNIHIADLALKNMATKFGKSSEFDNSYKEFLENNKG